MEEIINGLKGNGFEAVDYLVFGIYIVLLVGMGIFLSRGKKGQEKSSTDYFLAGNTLTWWAVGASLIAANISAEQFIGMSGTAYKSGIAVAAYELMAAATLLVVGKYLLPTMIEKKIFTIPQFLRDRYNAGTGLAFSIFWLLLYVFINLTSVSWLGALAIQQILGLPTDITTNVMGMDIDLVRLGIILALFIVAGVYSIYGGLASVAWTDVMQVTFLVGGGLITAYFALDAVAAAIGADGALDALTTVFNHLTNTPGDSHFNLVVERQPAVPITEDGFFSSPGITLIIGALWLTNLGYWGFNQYIIQKGLAAKSLGEAKKGIVFAAFLKIVIPFIVCIPGVCAFYIMNQTDLGSTLAGGINRPDDAYPFLIRNFTPVIVKGLSFAALTAAVISSLASMFNSTSTIFTMDIYRELVNKHASEKKLVSVGRLTSVVALVLALIAVYPLMGPVPEAFQMLQEYSGFVYPGVVVIFGLGLLWKRASGTAAIVTAIGTFIFSILFKIALPEVPFLIRMGYVFMVLVALFITISFASKKAVKADQLDMETIHAQKFWSRILLVSSVVCFIVGISQSVGSALDLEWAITMQNLGFVSIYFLAAMFLTLGIYLHSNATDKLQDPKAVTIDLSLFKTDRAFNIGAAGIIIILIVLYIALW